MVLHFPVSAAEKRACRGGEQIQQSAPNTLFQLLALCGFGLSLLEVEPGLLCLIVNIGQILCDYVQISPGPLTSSAYAGSLSGSFTS